MQRALIALERQHVVRLLLHELLGDHALTAHRVNRDNAARQCQQAEQGGQRGNLVRLCLDGDLAQEQPIGRRPRPDEMQRSVPGTMIMRAPHARPIQCNHLTGGLHRTGGNPGQEAALKPGRVEGGEHPPEGIVRGDAIGQGQERLQPGALRLAECLNLHPPVRPANHPAERDRDDVQQLMPFGSLNARINQRREGIVNTGTGRLVHPGLLPCRLGTRRLSIPSAHLPANPRGRCDCPAKTAGID